jgi:hypothetical protein
MTSKAKVRRSRISARASGSAAQRPQEPYERLRGGLWNRT